MATWPSESQTWLGLGLELGLGVWLGLGLGLGSGVWLGLGLGLAVAVGVADRRAAALARGA